MRKPAYRFPKKVIEFDITIMLDDDETEIKISASWRTGNEDHDIESITYRDGTQVPPSIWKPYQDRIHDDLRAAVEKWIDDDVQAFDDGWADHCGQLAHAMRDEA